MQVHRRISRIAMAAIVTAALTAPAASAMPIDGPGERGSQTQPRTDAITADLRTEANRGPAVPPTPPAGLPTWPSDPKPIVPPAAEPVAATDGDGGGLDWPAALIIAAGVVALTGGLVVLVQQLRTPRSRAAH